MSRSVSECSAPLRHSVPFNGAQAQRATPVTPQTVLNDMDRARQLRRMFCIDEGLPSVPRMAGVVNNKLVVGPITSDHLNLSLEPKLQPILGKGFPMQSWREPLPPVKPVPDALIPGYIAPPASRAEQNTVMALRLLRYELDAWRDRQDDFLDLGTLRLNARGVYERNNFSVLYRVDNRSPAALLATDGFGPSRNVNGITPMLDEDVLVTSACLRASNAALYQSMIPSITEAKTPVFQYAINSHGVTAASWLENFTLLDRPCSLEGHSFELRLDETHAAAAAIGADQIYVIGCDDLTVERQIAAMRSDGLGNIYGLSIRDYVTMASDYPHALAPVPRPDTRPAADFPDLSIGPDGAMRTATWVAEGADSPDRMVWAAAQWDPRI